MNMRTFIIGLAFGVFLSIVVSVVFVSFVVKVERITATRILVSSYEYFSGQVAPIDNRHLSDIGDLSESDQIVVRKLYGIHATDGATVDTFAPHAIATLPQWLVLLGRTYAAVWGW